MFCSKCGKELDGNERFCKYCGNSIDSQNVQEDNKVEKNNMEMKAGNDCAEIIPDNGKSTFDLVIKVLFGLLAVVLVWWNVTNIAYFEGFADFLQGNCILLCVGCFIIYAVEAYSAAARNWLLDA